jgi:DNA-binding LacI/PurR family transcriptional regulator
MQKRKKVSSIDVAREAGVSRATVSYVLNNVKNVKIRPETEKRVLDAVKKLGYFPNSLGKNLKTSRSMCIGFVSKRDVSEERFSFVLKGVKKVLDDAEYCILLCSDEKDDDGIPQFLKFYYENKIDGFILLSHIEEIDMNEISSIAALAKREGIPCVFADYHFYDPDINCVDIDYAQGGYIAARYLAGKGHRKIVYIDPGTESVQEKERIHGVRKALKEAGIPPECLVIEKSMPGEMEKLSNILSKRQNFNAIIAGWIHTGYSILYLANMRGIRIPAEFDIIALAGSRYSNLIYPRITTTDLPLYELGSRSAHALLESLKGSDNTVDLKLPCKLEIRDTC